jgi:hypothetical protein
MKCIAWVAVALALSSCDPDPACDEGQRADLGSCLPLSKDSGLKDAGRSADGGRPSDAGRSSVGTSDEDASISLAPDSGCTPRPGHYDGFGDSCTTDADCHSCIAPTCASSPLNMCSRINCQTNTAACPPGWQCADISAFSSDPTVTHICLKM